MGGDDADVAPPQNVPTKPKDGEVRIGNPDRVHPTRPDVESADSIGTGAAGDAAAHLNRVDAALREPDATTEPSRKKSRFSGKKRLKRVRLTSCSSSSI